MQVRAEIVGKWQADLLTFAGGVKQVSATAGSKTKHLEQNSEFFIAFEK